MNKIGKERKIEFLKGLQAAGQKWLPDDEYFRQFERGMAMATSDKDDDELIMQFWLYGRSYAATDNKYVAMPIAIADWPPEGHTKEEATEALGVMFGAQYPNHMLINIVHISEAWMSERTHDQPEEDASIAPSESPNRIEVVLVTALSLDRRFSQYFAQIQRDKEGKFTGLKKDEKLSHRHDPDNPTDPTLQRDYLSEHIYAGYNKLRQQGRPKEADDE